MGKVRRVGKVRVRVVKDGEVGKEVLRWEC